MRLLVFCLVFMAWTPFPAWGLEVRFRADVVARTEILTVGDVAEVIPKQDAQDLADAVLFSAPSPGETRCYKSRTLMAYVRDAASDGARIEWSGADNVCVRHSGARVHSGKLQSVIDDYLTAALSPLGARKVAFEMRNPPDALNLPEGAVEYEVMAAGSRILDARAVTVIVRVDGRVVENMSIPGRIQAYMPVAAAARKLKRGDVIAESDLVLRQENIAGLRRPLLDLETAVGKQVTRVVSMGQVLGENDLDAPVLVKRRDIVTMVLDQGPLQIRARGVATANGKQGEVILVQNMRSKREVACEVIGKKQVRVEF